MLRYITLKDLFKRYRRPGDLVFAVLFLLFSVFMLSQLGNQTVWKNGTRLVSQPGFWPAIALVGMTSFAVLHLVGSLVSPRLDGRWAEVGFWLRSVEYALWFMVYVLVVPQIGYLPATVLLAVLLALRLGYRSRAMLGYAALCAIAVVVLFKSLLQVRVPGGAVYEYLPAALRSFMLSYF